MFKIGDEVMDKDGNPYVIMGVGFGTYELRTPEGNMINGILEVWLAKYDPLIGPALVKMAEGIVYIEGMLNEIKNLRANMFEKARRKT
jgi:hypothetical protein